MKRRLRIASRVPARAAAALVAAAGLAGATAALADERPAPARTARAASAQATAYARDEGSDTPRGFVSVSGTGSRSGRGTSASTSTGGGKVSASASARVTRVSIFGDLASADVASVRATASGSATSASGSVSNLVVGGDTKGTRRTRAVYDLGGYGRLVVLGRSGAGIVALQARLIRAYGSYPAGATVRVAYAAAAARDATAPPPPASKPHKPAKPKPHAPAKPKAAKPKPKPGKPHKAKRRKPPRTRALLTNRRFVFPVYGKHSYSDDWGAPRQDTGTHEGNDIFATAGTPLVAVCDGTLHRVGTNTVPGNRLYLVCARGDEFFYGHLSAFASDARSGLAVKAGKVVGFVGSTGDAEQTPPHLHFEVHPGGGKAVDPYPFLRAWESRRDVPAAAWVRANGTVGRQPGSLVVVKDLIDR